jgi:ribosomal protein S8
MTTTLILQLPDDIAQQLQTEAQKQNTTPENIAAQRLMQTLESNPSPQKSLATDDAPLDNDDPLTQMFNRIYEANQTGQKQIQVKATPLTRQIADSLITQHIIDRIEMDETQTDVMILYMPTTPTHPPQFGPINYLQEFPTNDPEEIQILQKLQDPDPSIRIQGIHALRDRCLELT